MRHRFEDGPTKSNDQSTALSVERDGKGKIFSHVRKIWLHETPEERVRQEYLCVHFVGTS